MIATYDRGLVWRWTMYGTSKEGMEDTLEDAKAKFKIQYESSKAKARQFAPHGPGGSANKQSDMSAFAHLNLRSP